MNLFWPVENVSPFYEPIGSCAQNVERPNGYPHSGVDIPAPIGASVYATHDGFVRTVLSNGFAGHCVFLDIDTQYTVAYFHLNTIEVFDNTTVKAGDTIGTVGQSGGSLSPHLHISINTSKLRETNNIDIAYWLKTGSIRML